MARIFVGDTARYMTLGSAIKTIPLSVACWFNASDLTTRQVLFSMYSSAVSSEHGHFLELAGDVENDPVAASSQVTGGTKYSALSTAGVAGTGAWHHVLGYWATSSSRGVYLDGANKGTDTTTVNPGINRTSIGCGVNSAGYFNPANGLIAELAVWGVQLSDAEAALLATGIPAYKVRRANLLLYMPLVRANTDYRGGNVFTDGGTVAWGDQPRVYYQPPPLLSPRGWQTPSARPLVQVVIC